MIRSIFSRLLVSHIVVIILTTLTLGGLMSYLVRGHVVETKRKEMIAKAAVVATAADPVLATDRLQRRLELIGELIGSRIWVADRQGRVLAGDPPSRWAKAFPNYAADQIQELFASGQPQSWIRSSRRQADPSIIVAVPLSADPSAAVFLYTPIAGINSAAQAIDRLLYYSILFGVLAAAILGFFISLSLTRPIADISSAARRFAAGDYGSRTGATGRDEIGQLGQTFNTMAESLAKTEQNRREFLANASHELKTPVASIQALAEALQDGVAAGPEQRQRYLATIIAESRQIDHLLHDLLDLSQIEAGEMSFAPAPLDLAAFLTSMAAKYEHLLAPKRLSLAIDIPAGAPPVMADANRLEQVMANLVNNAIRFSPENGTIRVTAAFQPAGATVAVSDAGPGIPPADQPFIWERFYRVDKSRSRSGGGTGLGLAIAKSLVHAMGGEINLHSVPGEGATFTFTLPLA